MLKPDWITTKRALIYVKATSRAFFLIMLDVLVRVSKREGYEA